MINNSHNTIETQNINNIQNQQNNHVIININNFGNERLDHITPEFTEECIRAYRGDGICSMIEKIHFDPDVPENHNIKLQSSKNKRVYVKESDRWVIKDADHTIDKVMTGTAQKLIGQYFDSSIRDEDIQKYHGMLIQNLQSIRSRLPTLCTPIKKRIFAMICDLSRQLVDDTTSV
jgi:hypothetical protein